MKELIAGGDFGQAFTNAELDPEEQYYMYPPPSARQYDEQGRRLVWRVVKSLYGGKNAGRNWYLLLRKYLKARGFKQSKTEPCIFTRVRNGKTMIIGTYVDDLLVLYDDTSDFNELAAAIKKDFDFTVQSPMTEMCGLEVTESDSHITLTLEQHIATLASRLLTVDQMSTRVHVPCADTLPKVVDAAMASSASVDPTLLKDYREIVGSLLYIAMIVRPDIAYSVGYLSRAMSKPTQEVYDAAVQVLCYLYTTRHLGLRYNRRDKTPLWGQSDSDWCIGPSTSAYVFFLAGSAVSYLSKKQPSIAMSSTEAEIYAASLAGLEAVFLISLLEDLVPEAVASPVDIGVDNKGVVDMSQDFVANSRNRHFTRRHLKVRELVEEAYVKISSVKTENNASDILTKPLGKALFEKHRKTLLNM